MSVSLIENKWEYAIILVIVNNTVEINFYISWSSLELIYGTILVSNPIVI